RYWGRVMGAGPLKLRFDPSTGSGALALDGIELKGPLGLTRATGRWEFDGPLSFTGSIEGGSLAELFADTYGVSGPFELEAVVRGDTEIPIVDGALTSSGVVLSGSGLGSARLEAHLVGKELKVTGAPFADARGEVTMHTREPFPWVGALEVSVEDLRPWLPAAAVQQGLGGAFSGKLTGSGDLDSMDSLTWRAEL